MNLFRSEEHARRWSQFDPAYEMNLKSLSYWADRFSAEKYKARARTDHFSWCAENFSAAPPDQPTRKRKVNFRVHKSDKKRSNFELQTDRF
jgi:hypothetical protein